MKNDTEWWADAMNKLRDIERKTWKAESRDKNAKWIDEVCLGTLELTIETAPQRNYQHDMKFLLMIGLRLTKRGENERGLRFMSLATHLATLLKK